MSDARGVRAYFLYAASIFLSAFLLFQIQPIAGKLLLPWFGGSSGVWATSLLFFTSILFVGYLYTFFLTRASVRVQAHVHVSVLAVGALAALISLFVWGSIYPPLEWTIGSGLAPAAKTLLALLSGIGIPYFLLATTGPLLQYWYGMSAQREPYKLYAISNAGSLLALASYPFFVEPLTRLSEQEFVWTLFFLVFCGLCAFVSVRMAGEGRATHEAPRADASATPFSHKLLWIAYAALPAFLLVATTTEITQVIAPVPLLWVFPLSLYLLTFIIAFAGFRPPWWAGGTLLIPFLLLASAIAAWWFIDFSAYTVFWKSVSALALLFFLGLHAHGHLYRMRPATAHLPLFYLLIAFGGMLGTFAASLLAPVVFNDYHEFAVGLALAAALAFHVAPLPRFFGRIPYRAYVKTVIVGFSLGLIAFALYDYAKGRNADYALVSRNFYGTVKVFAGYEYRSLLHGTTLHGMQFNDVEREFLPLAYYVPESGVGRAFMHARSARPDHTISVGILGLGAGMTAAYCAPGDEFVYYEIDPRIERIAREYFTYLSRCPQAEMRHGDGRILLEKERRASGGEGYDLILADAFNDDTIPVHLLTREAIALYVSHLRSPESVVAVHISNRYLDMLPVLVAIAEEEGLSFLHVTMGARQEPFTSATRWVLLSPGKDTFDAPIFEGAASPLPPPGEAWTDDYSDLFSILHVP